MRFASSVFAILLVVAAAAAARAQITVLDSAQDQAPQVPPAVASPTAAPPLCGTQPMTLARMNWSSAALLAEIHARVLTKAFGCETRIVAGDLAATTSSMGSTGQPAVAPEMWVTRIAEVWNGAIETQMLRSAAPSFAETTVEGWFVPTYMETAFPEAPSAAALASVLAAETEPVRFISCPADWACAVINKNLIAAHGLSDLVEVVEPANRFEMDALIAQAVSRQEKLVFYYWQPNAVLAQLDFRALDMGAFSDEAMKCLAQISCADPQPSSFPAESVVIAVAEWVFTEAPSIAGYFQRASMPLGELDTLLAQASEPGATVEAVAERFVAERRDIWGPWTGTAP